MLKTLRTYRLITLLSVFALATSAFAPLSALCGMDLTELPVSETSGSLPCHEMSGMTLEHSMPMENEASREPEHSSKEMLTPPCCIAQGPAAPRLERVVQLDAPVTAAVSVSIASPMFETNRPVAAHESPPPPNLSRHLLFGCFLT